MTDCYRATVTSEIEFGYDGWLITIHELGALTQARHGHEEIDTMTQELIAVTTDQEGPFRVLYEFI